MQEKKVKKQKKHKKEIRYHSFDRMFLLVFPMCVSYFVLFLLGQIPLVSALIGLVLAVVCTILVANPVLKELGLLIDYLKQEAEGKKNLQIPNFVKKGREAFKILFSFNQIKLNWLSKTKQLEDQTLSDMAILERLPEPLLLVDNQGRFVWLNTSAKKTFTSRLVSRKASGFIPPGVFMNAIKRILSHETKQEEVDFSLMLHGRRTYFKAILGWLPAMSKNGGEIVAILHDTTEFKVFEKTQNAFFANASHELKTPLSVLSGFIETLQGSAKDDTQVRDKFLNIMKEQTMHMTDLVQDLLALSKADLESDTPVENIYLPELIRSVFQALELKAKKAQKQLVLEEKTLIAPLKGHTAELFRVFQNLIDNAIKYGTEKSTIHVEIDTQMKKEGSSFGIPLQDLIVSVHNEGSFIPEDERARLFERFYRMEVNRNVAGTGLGLAIAFEIIQKYQGQIHIESSLEEGTRFIVSIPLGL